MQISFLVKSNRLYAKIIGELDHHVSGEIKEQLDNKIISEGISKLIFDFSELTMMDSSGVGIILGRYTLMKSLGGEVYIISAGKHVDKLLSLSGICEIIKTVSTADEIEKLL